jgi:hypothetical protein
LGDVIAGGELKGSDALPPELVFPEAGSACSGYCIIEPVIKPVLF